MKLGEAIYKSSQEESGDADPDTPRGADSSDEDIVDADFEDLGDEKRD